MTNHPEHNFTKFYTPKGDDIYVEVGAAKGETAVLLPASVRKVLIEAEPISADNLERMVRSGELQNTIVVRKAIASEKGTQRYRVMGAHLNCSRLEDSPTHQFALVQRKEMGERPDWTPEGEPVDWKGYTIEVETDTLEAVLNSLEIDHVDLLASDCESCEFDMVRYAGKWLDPARVHNWAIAAYHIVWRKEEIFEQLRNAGYRIGTDEGGGPYHGDPATGRGQLVIYGMNGHIPTTS